MADAFSQFEIILKERLRDGIVNLTRQKDDVAWSIIGMMEPELMAGAAEYNTTSADFPAQLEAKWRVKLQEAGRVAGRKFAGNTLTAVGKDSHLYSGQAADAKYLDARLTPLASYIGIKMILKRIIGQITQNTQQFYTNLATTPLEELVDDSVMGAVSRFRSLVMNAFWGDGTASLAQAVGAVNVDETAGGQSVTLTAGGFGRFQLGDIIVAGSNANPRVLRTGNGVAGASGRMYVVDIDSTTNPGALRLQAGPSVGTVAISATDHLMLEETYLFGGANHDACSTVPQGVESLLINTGVFPGSISPKFPSGCDVAHYNALRAIIEGTIGGSEDPEQITFGSIIDRIQNSGTENALPTAYVAERALWTRMAYLDQQTMGVATIPAGRTFPGAGGVAGPLLSHQEHQFARLSSIRIRPKTVIGLNPETWLKFIPLGDRTVHWKYGRGPGAGISSIFMPIMDGTQGTELVAADFDAFCEFGVTDPRANFIRHGFNVTS